MINQHELDRPLMFVPQGHRVGEIWPTAKEYQLFDWSDIEALRVHPYYMQKALIALLFPELSSVIAWSGYPRLLLNKSKGLITIQKFIAVNWSVFIINDFENTVEIPLEHRLEPNGFRYVSLFTTAKYAENEPIKRHVRDDRRVPPVDIYNELPLSESIKTEFCFVSTSINSIEPIKNKSGWVYLGHFRIDATGVSDAVGVDEDDWVTYIHSQSFNHPDGSVTGEKIEFGIYDEYGLYQTTSLPQKIVSDEIKSARGRLPTLAQRILKAIDVDGYFQEEPIRRLLIQRIMQKYFYSGTLAKPNPFVYDYEDNKFKLNPNAVVASGSACVMDATGRGEGPLSGGSGGVIVPGQDTAFVPIVPSGEYGADQIYIFASPSIITWGDSSNSLDLEGSGQVMGCNVSCQVRRDDKGDHKIAAWTSMDRPDGEVISWSCPCEYVSVASANLKSGFSTDSKYAVGDGSFGHAFIVLEGMEQDLKAYQSHFAVLHNGDNSHFIALSQTIIKRSETSMKPPRGYENAIEWPGWKIISGHTKMDGFSVESDALYLPSDRMQQHFVIAWEKKGQRWRVTAYCGETEETLILGNIPVALEIEHVSDGRSDAARESGTDVINPAILTIVDFKTEKYEDEVPPEQNPCKGKEYFGYTQGTARVMITGVSTVPNANHKSVMVGLGNSYAGSGGCAGWLEVRHRAGSGMESLFDMKVGMGKTTSFGEHMPCFCGNSSIGQGIAHLPAIDGEYLLAWDAETGEISVTNPRGQAMSLFMYNPEMQLARFAFDMVGQAGLGGWIDSEYGSIEVLEFNGIKEGKSHWCERR